MTSPQRSLVLSFLATAAALLTADALPLRAADALPEVPPADLARLRAADFTDEELDLPYYLAHFHRVANAVESSGPDRGFIRLSVWRRTSDNQPHNARIMENILSLAYWYCLDRPWNPYRGHPAVRARLEAALDFWCRTQHSDGRYSEYAPQRWALAPTAFATKFMGETLILLKSGPPIAAALHARVVEANRRAIHATLTIPELYTHGKTYSNQFGNVWGGGLAHLSLYPDAGLRALWDGRFEGSRDDFQSPAGYYYERNGPDHGYTTNTHDHNSRQAWAFLRGTPAGELLLAKERRWFDWLAHNAVPEPNRNGFVYNRAVETRQRHTSFEYYDTPLGEFIPVARAWAESVEERAARLRRERAELERDWPRVPELKVGEFTAYSPYAFLHRRLREWRPTTRERDAARPLLPMVAGGTFTRRFADARHPAAFTYVRQPGYYAAFNSGHKIAEQQRYGLGLVWTPRLGAVLQSQTASPTAAWGTRADGAKSVYEDASLPAEFTIAGSAAPAIVPGVHDLPAGELVARYPLGKQGGKTVTFSSAGVTVAVQHQGGFTEHVPLLVPADGRVQLEPGRVLIVTPRGNFVVQFSAGAKAALADAPGAVLDKRIAVLTLRANQRLEYALQGAD